MRKPLKVFYDCNKCPAYCCSYPRIALSQADIKRLAKNFGLTTKEFKKKYCKKGDTEKEIILRHQQDEYFGTVCVFLDTESRRCKVYSVRPHICRTYPDGARCGYYEFLRAERERQGDSEFIALTYNNI